MAPFEDTRYFRLLRPFVFPALHRLQFRDERYVLFFSQILLSVSLYLLANACQELLLVLLGQLIGVLSLSLPVVEILHSLIAIG